MADVALTLVATPIGNLGDIAPRAIEALESASLIAVEDTRRTGSLLQHLGIAKRPFVLANEHTEHEATTRIIDSLADGGPVVLVSDAGMPAISDPGQRIVSAVAAAGYSVTVVPGASAVLAAVAISGLSTDRFCFEGFLPRKGIERSERIAALIEEPRTAVLFEAPHRIKRTLADLASVMEANRQVVVIRELTKKFEETQRFELGEVEEAMSDRDARGEYVIVLAGASPKAPADEATLRKALRAEIEAGQTRRSAVDHVVAVYGASKRTVYELALGL